MASPAFASVNTASARNGGFGACGEIGSENEAIPGQCRVVVACGNPAPASDGNVKKTAGSPYATRFELISLSMKCQTHAMNRESYAPNKRGRAGRRAGGGRQRRPREGTDSPTRRTQHAPRP